jgi:hypothetical protein
VRDGFGRTHPSRWRAALHMQGMLLDIQALFARAARTQTV